MNGEKGIVEPSFVYLQGVPGGDAIFKETGCDFFSVPIELGVRNSPITTISSHTKYKHRPMELQRPSIHSQASPISRRRTSLSPQKL